MRRSSASRNSCSPPGSARVSCGHQYPAFSSPGRQSSGRGTTCPLNPCTRVSSPDRGPGGSRRGRAAMPCRVRDVSGYAQRRQSVQGVDPHVVVRIGQRPGEGPGERGAVKSQPGGGDRGPAPRIRIRVARQQGQPVPARLRDTEPARRRGGGRAPGGSGVAGRIPGAGVVGPIPGVGVASRIDEHADVLAPADPPRSLQRRGTPLRLRRRLPQEEGDLMVRPHGHPPTRETVGGRRLPVARELRRSAAESAGGR